MKTIFLNKKHNKFQSGFTLIELLIVVAVIGILSGVLISVINVPRQKAVAQDGTKLSNLRSAAEAVEVYAAAEGSYPDQGGTSYNPLAGADAASVGVYIKQWPAAVATNTFDYFTYNSGTEFGILVILSTDAQDCYKYLSTLGTVSKCDNTCGYNATCTSIPLP